MKEVKRMNEELKKILLAFVEQLQPLLAEEATEAEEVQEEQTEEDRSRQRKARTRKRKQLLKKLLKLLMKQKRLKTHRGNHFKEVFIMV